MLRLDRMMADRKIQLGTLASEIGIASENLSRIKNGRVRAIRFATLEKLCESLKCQPGDLLEYMPQEEYDKLFG